MSDHHSKITKSVRSKVTKSIKEPAGEEEDFHDDDHNVTSKTINTRDDKVAAGKMFRDQLKKSIQDLE
tara:strand:+ start:91 stop:294 length:204 start_codon:yes stop_codon:yes gene_type:complete